MSAQPQNKIESASQPTLEDLNIAQQLRFLVESLQNALPENRGTIITKLLVLVAIVGGLEWSFPQALLAQTETGAGHSAVITEESPENREKVVPAYDYQALPAAIEKDLHALVRRVVLPDGTVQLQAIGTEVLNNRIGVSTFTKNELAADWTATGTLTTTESLSDTVVTEIAPDGAVIAAVWSESDNQAKVEIQDSESTTAFELPASVVPEQVKTLQSLVLVLAREMDGNNTVAKILYVFNRTDGQLYTQARFDREKGQAAVNIVILSTDSITPGVSLGGFGVVWLDLESRETSLYAWRANEVGDNVHPTATLVGTGNMAGNGGDIVLTQDFGQQGTQAQLFYWDGLNNQFIADGNLIVETAGGEIIVGGGRVGKFTVAATAQKLSETELQYIVYYYDPEKGETTKQALTPVPAPVNGAFMSSVEQEGEIGNKSLRLMVFAGGSDGKPVLYCMTISANDGSLNVVFLPILQR